MDHSEEIPNLIIECPNGEAIQVAISDLPCWVEEDGSLFRDPPVGIDAESQGWWLGIDETQDGKPCVRLQVQPGEDSLVVTKLTYEHNEKRNLDGWSFRLIPPPPSLDDNYFELADGPELGSTAPAAKMAPPPPIHRADDWEEAGGLEDVFSSGPGWDEDVDSVEPAGFGRREDPYSGEGYAAYHDDYDERGYADEAAGYEYPDDYDGYDEMPAAAPPGLGRWMIVIAGIFFVGLIVIQVVWMVAFRPLSQRSRKAADGEIAPGTERSAFSESPLAGGEEINDVASEPSVGGRELLSGAGNGDGGMLSPISPRERSGAGTGTGATGQPGPNRTAEGASTAAVGSSESATTAENDNGSEAVEQDAGPGSGATRSGASGAAGSWTIVSEGAAQSNSASERISATAGNTAGSASTMETGSSARPNNLPPSRQTRFPGGMVLQLGGAGAAETTTNSAVPPAEISGSGLSPYTGGIDDAPGTIQPSSPTAIGPISIDSVEEVDRATSSGLKLVLLNIFLRINEPLPSSRPVEIEVQFYERRPGDVLPQIATGGLQGRARVARPEDLSVGSIIKLQFRYVQRVSSAEYEGFAVRLLQDNRVLEQRIEPASLLDLTGAGYAGSENAQL
jgi:hypothetical protein